MNYRDAWQSFAALINGIKEAAFLHSQFMQSHNKNPYGVSGYMQDQYVRLRKEIVIYCNSFREQLPIEIMDCLTRFSEDPGKQIDGNSPADELLGRAIVIKIVAFAAEIAYLMSDRQEEIRSRCELAFLHLQRLIAVDGNYRQNWISAYQSGEVNCEKLGSVHLLWHGIWAFKIDAAGARTDLIFPEPPEKMNSGASIGLVLTEWKLDNGDASKAFLLARQQAKLYSSGALNGAELTNVRFAVVISEKTIATPANIVENEVTWRHINIAVDPDVPSKVALQLLNRS